jgi:hypothetical protein
MIRPAFQSFVLACGLGCAAGGLLAQTSAVPPSPLIATAAAKQPAVPPFPKMSSPVDTFRELLAMKLSDRKQFLTNRPPETQKRILAKVREYESLKPDERELRLRATELRWYLLPLMSLAPTNRAARLALVPEEQRPLVEDRLKQWDTLPSETQQELLSNEQTAEYFARLEAAATGEQREKILSQLSPERQAKLQAGMDRWRGLSEEQRQKKLRRFNEFFELTPVEKEKALNLLSDAERRQMEKVMESYASLNPAQRAQCLRSFGKFTGMSLGERLQFLKNAERWKLMTPTERESWRNLVKMAPLLPPQPNSAPRPPAPPMPRRPGIPVATN